MVNSWLYEVHVRHLLTSYLPLWWEKFETNLSDDCRSTTTLLAPNSGILQHLRELCITEETDANGDHSLESLIMALPRDRLRSFEAY